MIRSTEEQVREGQPSYSPSRELGLGGSPVTHGIPG
jgi:hypothetical protein